MLDPNGMSSSSIEPVKNVVAGVVVAATSRMEDLWSCAWHMVVIAAARTARTALQQPGRGAEDFN